MDDEAAKPLETEVVDAGPDPELAPAVDKLLEGAQVGELAVYDPTDEHEVMLAMDEHDIALLLDYVQTRALRKWVYELAGQKDRDGRPVIGLTIHAVQDIVQRMNWTGKAKIGVLLDGGGRPVLERERIVEDGKELWLITAWARDEATGTVLPGAATQPVRMKLKASTAKWKRENGEVIPDDDTVFDAFSYTKGIQKAVRNALKAFIPQEVEQTVLAMFHGNQERVQRIQTKAEEKLSELPPPITGPEADERMARIRGLYDSIKELGGGQGRFTVTPQQFHAFMTQSQHSLERLDDMIGWLEGEHERLSAHFSAQEKDGGS